MKGIHFDKRNSHLDHCNHSRIRLHAMGDMQVVVVEMEGKTHTDHIRNILDLLLIQHFRHYEFYDLVLDSYTVIQYYTT